MKKTFAILLILLVALTMLWGCTTEKQHSSIDPSDKPVNPQQPTKPVNSDKDIPQPPALPEG